VTSKFIGVIYWPWPIFLSSTMTVTHKLFKILSGHDVANGRTDGRTDGRTPYHNTSEVLLRAYKNGKIITNVQFSWQKQNIKGPKVTKNVASPCLCCHKQYNLKDWWRHIKKIKSKVIASVKFSWRADGRTVGQSDPCVSPFLPKGDKNSCGKWGSSSERRKIRTHWLVCSAET